MKKVENEVRVYLKERGWNNLRPSDIAKSISIEAAELLELFQWSDKTIEQVKADAELFDKLKKELADVFLYAFDMAVLLDLDSKEVVLDKLKLVKQKYPAEAINKSHKAEGCDPGEDSLYLQIKQKHRQEK